MAVVTPTTELEAVNVMLSTIGESPVNTLEDDNVVDAAIARTILGSINREVQSIGWNFNTEIGFPILKDSLGKFPLPANTARVDTVNTVESSSATDYDLVLRGKYLYDRKNHTDVFTQDLKVIITFQLDFTEMPEQFRYFVLVRASRKFANRFLGSQEIEAFTLRDEIEAKARAIESDSENADRTIFDNYDVQRVIDR